jgi:hypothetical protein
MPLLMRKLAILTKLEVTYGVDPVPTGAANSILARNVKLTPITTVRESRDLYRPFLGNSDDVIGAFYGQIQFDVEAAGAGTAGGIPGYGPLLRACGFAQVNNPGVSTVYTPVSGSFESCVQYMYLDGVLHKFMGARGSVSFKGSYRSATLWSFDFMGLFVPVLDAALPTVNYSAFVAPLAFNKANTPTFNIHGVNGAVLRNLSFDLANQVVYRNLVNSETVRIVDRKPVGAIEMQAELMAVKNWFNTVRDAATGTMQVVHGTVPGNIIEITTPALQLSELSYGEFEGDAMLTGNTKLMPTTAGNDEMLITVR